MSAISADADAYKQELIKLQKQQNGMIHKYILQYAYLSGKTQSKPHLLACNH